jgi:hypothetical protein
MRAQEFITERKKRSKKSRGLGGYFFPGYGFYGGDASEGGGDGGGGGESKQGMSEAMAADQVLDYVKRAHAPEAFDIEYSITDHPEWELKNIPLSQLNLDPDGEEPDPYNRVNWVDNDKVQELIPQIEAVLKRMPIVVDSQGWIIDGNHRAMAASEAGLTSVPALVPVKQDMTEGTEQKPVVIYTNNKGATIDDDIKKSLRTTQEPFNKLQMWEKHKSMKDPKIADWVTNKESAAALKEPSLATASKARNAFSGRMPIFAPQHQFFSCYVENCSFDKARHLASRSFLMNGFCPWRIFYHFFQLMDSG